MLEDTQDKWGHRLLNEKEREKVCVCVFALPRVSPNPKLL